MLLVPKKLLIPIWIAARDYNYHKSSCRGERMEMIGNSSQMDRDDTSTSPNTFLRLSYVRNRIQAIKYFTTTNAYFEIAAL